MSPIRQIVLGAVIGVVFGLPFGFTVTNLSNIRYSKHDKPSVIKTTDPLAGHEIETIREMIIRYEINRHR
jgi:hypothetical protein